MSVSKKALKRNEYKLKGSLRKCGFDRWRYVFNAVNRASGDERNFFIELSILNPAVSPQATVVYESQVEKLGESDLQAALSGNLDSQSSYSQTVPSYCCVRAGILGDRPRALAKCFPCDEFVLQKNGFDVKVGECFFSDSDLSGLLTVTKNDLVKNPQPKSDAGRMVWDLKYRRVFDTKPVPAKNSVSWFATGIYTEFSGTVSFDGVEYVVSPESSFGYTDKIWGSDIPFPFVHISCPRLTNVFTGRPMPDSGFAVEGEFDGNCASAAKFLGDEYSFGKGKKIKKFTSIWSCVRTPSNSGTEELHWSVSLNSKKYILDIDVFCDASEMIVKEYCMTHGHGEVLRVLGGASAMGEIRLYRQRRKTLELIQHAKISKAFAEYGEKDTLES